MKKTTITILVATLAIISLIGFRLASNKKKIDEHKKPVGATVTGIATLAPAVEGTVSQQLVKTGNLIPFKEADLVATTAGKVAKVNFNLGSSVRAGATLVQLDNRLKELSLEATQLSIDRLKKDVTRYNTLLAG